MCSVASCKYEVWDKNDINNNTPIYILELMNFISKYNINANVLDITEIYVDPRHRCKGYGTLMINQICTKFSNHIIVLLSGALDKEYDSEPDDNEMIEIKNRLSKFYTHRNFVSVNDMIGYYQFKEVFIYNNAPGKEILHELTEKINQ